MDLGHNAGARCVLAHAHVARSVAPKPRAELRLAGAKLNVRTFRITRCGSFASGRLLCASVLVVLGLSVIMSVTLRSA